MTRGGYMGRILEVDLSKGTSRTMPTPDDMQKDFIGGRGFVAKLLWELGEGGDGREISGDRRLRGFQYGRPLLI